MKTLPLQLMVKGDVIANARVVSVNENTIAPIQITDIAVTARPCEEGFECVDAEANIKALGKHFSRGFNRFTVQVGEFTDDVMLDVEL